MNSFALGIPVQFAVHLHGNVAHQAGGAGTVAYFGRCHRFFAGSNGIEPVVVLFGGLVEVDLIGTYLGLQDLGIAGIQGLQF